MSKKNKTKQLLKDGKAVIETMSIEISSPEVTPMMVKAGFGAIRSSRLE